MKISENPKNEISMEKKLPQERVNYCIGRVEEALEGFEYIIENELKSVSTYANFILVLLHLDQDEEVITQYKDLLQLDINIYRGELRNRYNEELRVTQVVLQKEDLDEKTKDFNAKKLKGINTLLSFLNQSFILLRLRISLKNLSHIKILSNLHRAIHYEKN